MSELAMELGHSLLFPVTCRYCGKPIYLFASPSGGFAIFDSLGPPWPKHCCGGYSERRVVDCSFPTPRPTRYLLPVPDTVDFLGPSIGNSLTGIIVGKVLHDHPRRKQPLWQIDVYRKKSSYHGDSLCRILVDKDFPLGACISGKMKWITDVGEFLQDAVQLLPPDEPENSSSLEGGDGRA
jgi:hypothetical protein